MKLGELSDAELLDNVARVVGARRRITATLVAYLAEVDGRRLHLKAAYSSLYDFCTRRLSMSEGSAYRHVAGAKVARRFPVVLGMLRDGRMHLTGLSLLAKYLTPDNCDELLDAAATKSSGEIEHLLRARFPKPELPGSVRRVPVQEMLACGAVGGSGTRGEHGVVAAAERSAGSAGGADDASGACFGAGDRGGLGSGMGGRGERRARVAPVSAERFQVQFTAGAETKAKLERALDLMSHRDPTRDLSVVFDKALDALLAELEKKKLGVATRARRSRSAKHDAGGAEHRADARGAKHGAVSRAVDSKHGAVSRAVRREVFERDGERCSYVSESGERCAARAFLELDHAHARALGGGGDAGNIRVLCRAHNRLSAETTFGRQYVEGRIHLRQRRLGGAGARGIAAESDVALARGDGATRGEEQAGGDVGANGATRAHGVAAESEANAALGTQDKLLSALTAMGFRPAEARRALARMDPRDAHGWGAPLNGLLRQALSLLVR